LHPGRAGQAEREKERVRVGPGRAGRQTAGVSSQAEWRRESGSHPGRAGQTERESWEKSWPIIGIWATP
jgi:hypothetical protein